MGTVRIEAVQAGREAYGGHVSKVWWVGVVFNVRERESSEGNRKQEMDGEKKKKKSGKKRGSKKKIRSRWSSGGSIV